MVLERQNHRIVGCDERTITNRIDHISEQNVRAHGHAVRDDRLLVLALAVPAVQLHAPAAGQQRLPIHLDRTLAAKLPPRQIRVMRRIDVVVGQWLVHFHVLVQPVQEHRRILVGHQVAHEAVFGQQFVGAHLLVLFVRVDDLAGALFLVQRVQDLVQARITLLFVQKIDELVDIDVVGFALGTVRGANRSEESSSKIDENSQTV